ncbi:MAG TPA: ABC transporter permease/substrate-binding protein [Xanthobacteraceae bacterium]|jgi:osmoprotectant transport system permease protein|nr:ABC transporter permease/substrate-binding protein [Xanthobacteraceae bacterium]
MNSQLAEAWARLPAYLGGHVAVSVTAMLLGLAISLPLALLSLRRPTLRRLLLGFASVVQTIPSLALLALFYPLLLGIAALSERLFGAGFSALGFLPAVLALMLYSMLPVLWNTVTGLLGIEPAIREAALGVGMTRAQSLIMVELPLAMPVIMAGVRTAAIWVIGAATLSTPIGQTSLGNYIFTGLQTQNWVFVLFGCLAAAVFALAVDQLLALMENGLTQRKRGRVTAAALGLALLGGAALAPNLSRATDTYVIGAKPFTEQYVLAALMRQRLQDAGLTVSVREGLGSAVIFNALAAGEIDAYVDYSGTIWANQMRRRDVLSRGEVRAGVAQWLEREHGIAMLGGLGFENAYALAMPRARAQALGIRSIADLAQHSAELSLAGDYEFFGRPEWNAIRMAYGLAFRERQQMQSEFMYQAAAHGDVDVIAGYTSDGRIAQYGLTVLDDPRHVIPPYDAIILVSAKRKRDEALLDALRPLVGAIDITLMREANLRAASGNGASPSEAARWLSGELQRRGDAAK